MPLAGTPTAHVVGSINRDIVAYAPRLPKPGETVLGTRGALFPGGKGANQAVAIARLGGRCRMVGRVGADGFGGEMTAFLSAEGVDIAGVETVGCVATGFALITVDDRSENLITVVPGANAMWPDGLPPMTFAPHDVVVAQLEVPLGIVQAAFAAARGAGARCVLNPAPFQALPEALLALTDILVLNETELAQLAGVPESPDAADDVTLGRLVAPVLARGPGYIIVTLGRAGVSVHARDGGARRIASHAVLARDTTGAGDCFAGALVARLLAGDDVAGAAIYGTAAAALSVTRDGAAASYPTAAEVGTFLLGQAADAFPESVPTPSRKI